MTPKPSSHETKAGAIKVIVIGAGPVGLLTALRLAQSGMYVDVLEKEEKLNVTPRACSYYAAALHALQRAKVLDDVKKAGFTTHGLCWRGPLEDDGKGGKIFGDMLASLPVVGNEDWDSGVVNLQQAKLTKLLYQKVLETGRVTVHLGTELIGIEQDSASVMATAVRGDLSQEQFQGSFLVGADGGRSTTRRLLGIRHKGHSWPERLVAMDVLLDDVEFDEKFPSSLFVDPVYYGLMSPLEQPRAGTESLWRCTVAVDPTDARTDDELVSDKSIEELLLKTVPGPRPLPFKVLRASPYRVHQLCASTFNRGRCALAGDAAHLNNPMGAMGLTTGLIDSEALADALELIIHEGKPISILDTYSDERRRVFQTFVDPTSTQNKLRCAKFAKDLLIDPSTRDVHDVTHNLAAVASSTSLQKAQDFLSAINAPSRTTAYGSYESLLADPTVEIVYISTPHSHHFQNARAALLAGKHVLLEKAFTVNAAQACNLVQLAREKKLFLMEAMWTRFFPLTQYVRQLIKNGAIGVVQRVVADRNLGRDIEKLYGTEHRLVNSALAGGALLDLAIYPLTWIFQILYHDSPLAFGTVRSPPHISSSLVKYTPTGVDETATIIVTFPESKTQGIATASLRFTSDPTDPGIFGPAARPLSITVVAYGEGSPKIVERKDFKIPVGHGLFWEADACARSLFEGKTESDLMPLDETLLIMEVIDRVREENGLRYPADVEAH
ncbi:hypothetical protein BDV38DRAFT_291238 [Aspergillus pseudotamarii]|uniref:D-xylose 1-dehydrogenase (NADP(+), D-xylono-1,5-lactone-forming) n=1 Tax=Aspergillus pseudotamarii TaxID=132259 RepID=A0A5N6T0T3_ASPPS|nr:uncharacterized protein BDV38DRAFT_291238 [Aspergillus pseudotamarii]KAE8139523.1 hypothetical protein BDV38DRAFT_291238 [Aspergillus pseudotamarii]